LVLAGEKYCQAKAISLYEKAKDIGLSIWRAINDTGAHRLRRAFSPAFRAGGMVLFIPWRVGAEESGAAIFGFGGAMLLDLLEPPGRCSGCWRTMVRSPAAAAPIPL
jgi:hypothetical protein